MLYLNHHKTNLPKGTSSHGKYNTRYEVSSIELNTPKGMVSQKLPANTKPIDNMSTAENVGMMTLSILYANFPDALIIIRTSTLWKKSSSLTICADEISETTHSD